MLERTAPDTDRKEATMAPHRTRSTIDAAAPPDRGTRLVSFRDVTVATVQPARRGGA